jgi:hypothetical protein
VREEVIAVLMGVDAASPGALDVLEEAEIPVLGASAVNLAEMRSEDGVLWTGGLAGALAAFADHAATSGAERSLVVYSDYLPAAFAASEVAMPILEARDVEVVEARLPYEAGDLSSLRSMLREEDVDAVLVAVTDDLCADVVGLATELQPDATLYVPSPCATPAIAREAASTGTEVVTNLEMVPTEPASAAALLLGDGRVDPALYVASIARYGASGLPAIGATSVGFRSVMNAAALLRDAASGQGDIEIDALRNVVRDVAVRPTFGGSNAVCERRVPLDLVALCAPQQLLARLQADGVTLLPGGWIDVVALFEIAEDG